MKPTATTVLVDNPDKVELRAKAVQQRIEFGVKGYEYQGEELVEVVDWR